MATAVMASETGARRPTAHWLAAYALGLASSAGDRDIVVDMVLAVSGGDHDTLVGARRQLYALEIYDEGLREAAARVLASAAARRGEDASGAASGGAR